MVLGRGSRTDVAGGVFVVTGGGNGIGREVVRELVMRGATVAAVDVDAAGLAETADQLRGARERVSTHSVDLTDRDAVDKLATTVLETHGRVDGLVNVAGIIQPFVPIADVDIEVIQRVMAVNFWGVVHTVKAFLPHLLNRPSASLVNVSSMGAFVAVPGQTAYGASKAAVKLLTEGLYAELRGTTVHVTAVYPGGVATDIATNSGTDTSRMDAADAPMQLTSPQSAAHQLVDGIERRAYRVVIGKDAAAFDLLSRLSPRRSTELIARKLRSLIS
jgi:short-subunit dehydrogenase